MTKPLIGISGRRWNAEWLGAKVPKAMYGVTFDLHFADYGKSVALAGGLPIELTRDAAVEEMVEHLDALVLSGGADINPARYGEAPHEHLGPTEDERDEWELNLFAAARSKGIPVLGICRGFQLVNVAYGGTLKQHLDISDGVGHPQWDVDGRSATHEVEVLPGTITSSLYEATIGVNSLHHQCVERLGADLIVSAKAPDGVIEGVETADGLVLALQWHPELMTAPDPSFGWLVEQAQRSRDLRIS